MATSLARLVEYHDHSGAELLVDSYGYRTALSQLGQSGRVEYSECNHIKRWIRTFKTANDRFSTTSNGGPVSICRWPRRFVHYSNTQRPQQALDSRTPAAAP